MARLRWERRLGLPRVQRYSYLLNLPVFSQAIKRARISRIHAVLLADGDQDIAGGLHVRRCKRPKFRYKLAKILGVEHDKLWIYLTPDDPRGKDRRWATWKG